MKIFSSFEFRSIYQYSFWVWNVKGIETKIEALTLSQIPIFFIHTQKKKTTNVLTPKLSYINIF